MLESKQVSLNDKSRPYGVLLFHSGSFKDCFGVFVTHTCINQSCIDFVVHGFKLLVEAVRLTKRLRAKQRPSLNARNNWIFQTMLLPPLSLRPTAVTSLWSWSPLRQTVVTEVAWGCFFYAFKFCRNFQNGTHKWSYLYISHIINHNSLKLCRTEIKTKMKDNPAENGYDVRHGIAASPGSEQQWAGMIDWPLADKHSGNCD